MKEDKSPVDIFDSPFVFLPNVGVLSNFKNSISRTSVGLNLVTSFLSTRTYAPLSAYPEVIFFTHFELGNVSLKCLNATQAIFYIFKGNTQCVSFMKFSKTSLLSLGVSHSPF